MPNDTLDWIEDVIRDAEQHGMANDEGTERLKEKMKEYDGEYRLVWSDDLLNEIQQRPKRQTFLTGLTSLDEITGGFMEKQVITVAAHSKHGKTAFGLFLLGCLEKMNPVMIPLEQSNEELVEQLNDNGWPIPNFLSPRNLAARVSTTWIEERIVEGIAKYNTKLVVIDHLGYINDMDGEYKKENLAYRIEKMMQNIKNIAKKWDVVVVLLVHIVKADEGKPPSLEDLKGSQSILGESDKVIMLWRKNALKKKIRVYENKTLVSVLANRRNGRNGNVGLRFENGKYIEDNTWVQSMVESAERAVEQDDLFE